MNPRDKNQQLFEKIKHVRQLVSGPEKSNASLDRALALMREVLAQRPNSNQIQDLGQKVQSIYDKYQKRQKEILQLEQDGRFDEAIAKLKSLSVEGLRDFRTRDEVMDIHAYQATLQQRLSALEEPAPPSETENGREKERLVALLGDAQALLKKEEFNEALSLLEEAPESPDVADLRTRIERKRSEKIDRVVSMVNETIENNQWEEARELVARLQSLDPTDGRAKAVAKKVSHEEERYREENEHKHKLEQATSILAKSSKDLKDIENAIRYLEEAAARRLNDPEVEALLTRAHRFRGEVLESQGLVATLEQAGEYEEALKKIDNLIQKGMSTYEDVKGRRDIFEAKTQLEVKVREFAESKAAKQHALAADVMEKDPHLAMEYIEKGLGLPYIPKNRREALENLKLEAKRAIQNLEDAESQVREGLRLMDESEDYQKAASLFENVLARHPHLDYVNRHLERARKGRRSRLIRDARMKSMQVKGLLATKKVDQVKQGVRDIFKILEGVSPDEEIQAIQAQCESMMATVHEQDAVETEIEEAIPLLEEALKSNLDEARVLLESMGSDALKDPRIRRYQTRLNQKENHQQVLENIQILFHKNDLAPALEEIRILRGKVGELPEVVKLEGEIVSTHAFRRACDAFENGYYDDAKRGFSTVVRLASLYVHDAQRHLEQIAANTKREAQSETIYDEALTLQLAGNLKEAYHLLTNYENPPSSHKTKITELQREIREAWHKHLREQIEKALQTNKLPYAHDLVHDMEAIQASEDTLIISKVRKEYAIKEAQVAERSKNWAEALRLWREAENFDFEDERIRKGIQKSLRNKAIAEFDATENLDEKIDILEEIYDPQHVDRVVDRRLMLAFIARGKHRQALTIASTRGEGRSRFAKQAKEIKALCLELEKAQDKFDKGAYQASVKIVQRCARKFPNYKDLLQELFRTRTEHVVDALLDEARDLASSDEGIVKNLSKYREILAVDPDHPEAKKRCEDLNAQFEVHIGTLAQDSLRLDGDENARMDEVVEKIHEIREAITIANEKQKIKLRPHLERLAKRESNLKAFNRIMNTIKDLLADAVETGEFGHVDRKVTDALNYVPIRNWEITEINKKIREAKENRKQIEALAHQIRDALTGENFTALEDPIDALERLDPDDTYKMRKEHLIFKDPDTGEALSLNALKAWARTHARNLEEIRQWRHRHFFDPDELVERENRIRKEADETMDHQKLGEELNQLSKYIAGKVNRIPAPPVKPLSAGSRALVEEMEKIKRELFEKAERLVSEATDILDKENEVQNLVADAGKRIDEKDYENARPLIERGLALAPYHKLLKHFISVVRNES